MPRATTLKSLPSGLIEKIVYGSGNGELLRDALLVDVLDQATPAVEPPVRPPRETVDAAHRLTSVEDRLRRRELCAVPPTQRKDLAALLARRRHVQRACVLHNAGDAHRGSGDELGLALRGNRNDAATLARLLIAERTDEDRLLRGIKRERRRGGDARRNPVELVPVGRLRRRRAPGGSRGRDEAER